MERYNIFRSIMEIEVFVFVSSKGHFHYTSSLTGSIMKVSLFSAVLVKAREYTTLTAQWRHVHIFKPLCGLCLKLL